MKLPGQPWARATAWEGWGGRGDVSDRHGWIDLVDAVDGGCDDDDDDDDGLARGQSEVGSLTRQVRRRLSLSVADDDAGLRPIDSI